MLKQADSKVGVIADDAIRAGRAYELRWWILGVMALAVLVVVLSSSVVNIALPTMQRELSATMSDLQWIVNAYMLTLAGLMLTMGALGDRWGRGMMLNAGILVFGGASLAAMFAKTAVHVIVCRAFMGVGAAMILPTTLAIITNVFPHEERGRAIGVWAGLNSIGIALGPIIGGLLIQHFRWTSIFFLNIPIAAIAVAGGIFLVPNSRNPRPKPLDLPGTGLSIVGLGALIFGLVQGGDWGWSDPAVIGSLAGAAVFIAAFVAWERTTRHPMLELGFFRRPRFSCGVGAVSIMSLGLVGVTFSLTLFMQFVKGYDALQTGVRLAPLAVGIFLGAGSADRLVKRFGTTGVMAAGFVGVAAISLLIAFASFGILYWKLGLIFFGLGLFLGFIAAPATDAVMGALPRAKAGIGSAMNTVSRMVAGAVGVAALGSALSSVYTASFLRGVGVIEGLPAAAAEAAGESVGAGIIVSSRLPASVGEATATLARESFMEGWHVMAYIALGLCLLGAIVILRFMPGRRALEKSRSGDRPVEERAGG